MSEYSIYEGNMDKLEKRLTTIGNKCKKYGVSFTYEKIGEEYKEHKFEDGHKETLKFIKVSVEGAVKNEGWEFIATINHSHKADVDNIIRVAKSDVEIPERYYHTESICEHCHTLRTRTDTYLIRNIETGEFKQVGKSCLKEFTNGLSAEMVASYLSVIDECEKEIDPDERLPRQKVYYKTSEVLETAFEVADKFGYVSKQKAYEGERDLISTAWRVIDYLLQTGTYENENVRVNLDPTRKENKELAQKALTWVKSLSDEEISSSAYLRALKVLADEEYIEGKNIGYICGLVPTYHKAITKEEKERIAKETSKSTYQGEVGERLTLKLTGNIVSSGYGQFGDWYLYNFQDENGNVFTWFSSKLISDNKDDVLKDITLKGTVKEFKEYKGIKQTVLTRCKVVK